MAIELWLLRHGAATPHGSRPDHDRPLTAKGEEQSRDAGRALVALGYEFSALFTSPKVRALETARLAGEALGLEPVIHEPLSTGADAADIRVLQEAAGGRVLVVGHDPYFSQLVHDTTGARVGMAKGGIAGIRLDGTASELAVLLRPREISAIVTQNH